jgi:hypothetical protein
VDDLLAYGPLGIFVVLFVGGLIFSKSTVDRLIAERDRAETQRDSIIADVMEKVAPALERAVEAVKDRTAFETDIRDILIDVRRMLEQRP